MIWPKLFILQLYAQIVSQQLSNVSPVISLKRFLKLIFQWNRTKNSIKFNEHKRATSDQCVCLTQRREQQNHVKLKYFRYLRECKDGHYLATVTEPTQHTTQNKKELFSSSSILRKRKPKIPSLQWNSTPGVKRPSPPLHCEKKFIIKEKNKKRRTLEMMSGVLKSRPPTRRKPHGEGPVRVTVWDISDSNSIHSRKTALSSFTL